MKRGQIDIKKRRITAALAVLIAVILCFAGGKYYFFRDNTQRIISLEIPPFCEEIKVEVGEKAYENFFEVIYQNGFKAKDISFISENENIAAVKYCVIDRNRYVCFSVEGRSAGETYIYFSANNGETLSEKIKVTVTAGEKHSSYTQAYASENEEKETAASDITEKSKDASKMNETPESEAKQNSADNITPEKNPTKSGNAVYVTPYGKRYHYSKSCAGKNAVLSDKASAAESGRTPCKKCAGV